MSECSSRFADGDILLIILYRWANMSTIALNVWATGATGESMRLPLKLRDSTGDITVTFWSAQFNHVIPYNVDALSTMWEACGEGDEAQQEILDKIDVNATKEYSWTLRPHKWKRNDDETVLQWSVHAVNDVE